MEKAVLNGVINDVVRKDLTRNSDGKPFTVWDVETTCGKISANRQDLAQKAYELKGQSVYFDVSVKENGTFTNYYLNGIKADHQTVPNGAYDQPGRFGGPLMHPDRPDPNPVTMSQPQSGPSEKDLTIWRQTATKVAALTSKTPQEFWSNVGEMLTFYEYGLMPEHASYKQQDAAMVGSGYAAANAPGDDGIPF